MPKYEAEQFELLLNQNFKPVNDKTPWTKGQTRVFLDMHCAGEHPHKIARTLKRTPEAIQTRIKEFEQNLHGRAVRYVLRRRISRIGKPFSENELKLVRHYKKLGLPMELAAKVCARHPKDFRGMEVTLENNFVKPYKLFTELELIWAYRYAYERYKDQKTLISDQEYNDMVREAIEFGGSEAAFLKIKHSTVCPDYIKTLALCLYQKHDFLTSNPNKEK